MIDIETIKRIQIFIPCFSDEIITVDGGLISEVIME